MTISVWDKIAKIYDKFSGEDGDYCHKYIIYPEVVDLLGNISGKRILELGCGTGTLCRKLGSKPEYCLGLDYSEKMLEIASARDTKFKNIHYEQKDIRQPLDIENDSFDFVVLSMVLHTIAPEFVETVLSEAYRVLKPGGICVTALPHPAFINEFRHLTLDKPDQYLTQQKGVFAWKNGETIDTEFYARPLNYYINTFTKLKFQLSVFSEPRIVKEGLYASHEAAYARRREIPSFLVLKHVK